MELFNPTSLTKLNSFAYKLTQNRVDADDLVQNTVLRALTKRHLFDGAKPTSWLFRIAYNVFISDKRSRSRYVQNVAYYAVGRPTAVSAHSFSACYAQEVVEAIGKLPQRYRDTLVAVTRDTTPSELAVSEKIGRPGASKRVVTARAALRVVLGETAEC